MFAALKLPRPENVQTEIEERGVSIQKARRKRTHDIAIIHVSSCNDVLALLKMSLATFHIELGLHSMCMSLLHALYFTLRTSYSMCMYPGRESAILGWCGQHESSKAKLAMST